MLTLFQKAFVISAGSRGCDSVRYDQKPPYITLFWAVNQVYSFTKSWDFMAWWTNPVDGAAFQTVIFSDLIEAFNLAHIVYRTAR